MIIGSSLRKLFVLGALPFATLNQENNLRAQEVQTSPQVSTSQETNQDYDISYSILRQDITQQGGTWEVTLTVKCNKLIPKNQEESEEQSREKSLNLTLRDIDFEYSANNLSNSTIKEHSHPPNKELSCPKFNLGEQKSSSIPVISSPDKSKQCEEKIEVEVLVLDINNLAIQKMRKEKSIIPKFVPLKRGEPLTLTPTNKADSSPNADLIHELNLENVFKVKVRISHEHDVYGPIDPLLGERTMTATIGPGRIYDIFFLDREVSPLIIIPKLELTKTLDGKEEDLFSNFKDTHYYHSAPDSIHLAADERGMWQLRFSDIPVRYGTKVKLVFWYAIAKPSEGVYMTSITEYNDSKSSGQVIEDAGFQEILWTDDPKIDIPQEASKEEADEITKRAFLSQPKQGQWHRFEKEITLTRRTTTIAVQVAAYSSYNGKAWVNDLNKEGDIFIDDIELLTPDIKTKKNKQ